MPTIEEIVKALRCSLDDFATFFSQAQARRLPKLDFRLIRQQAGSADPIEEALRQALAQGFLPELIVILAESGLEDGTLASALARDAAARNPGSPLQAIINKAQGTAQPQLALAGFQNAMRWTGKVSIDGNAKGTGVLIAPHLLLTAWHVMSELFVRQGSTWVPSAAPGTAARITVEFDDFLTYLDGGQRPRPPKPVKVSAHDQWCVAWCPCHNDELQDRFPTDLAQLDGLWDYLVLRLSPPPGVERRWVSLTANAAVPRANDRIVVFQHPSGQPMTYDDALIVGEPKTTVDKLGRRRFLHSVNTTNGSSGGPCFDRDFVFFGIHQGVWKKSTKKKQGANRGIPLCRVLDHIETNYSLPPADPTEIPIWNLGDTRDSAPVIGCDEFQKLVWRAATNKRPSIIVLAGGKGSGKTFQVALLHHMLPEGNHLKVRLEAQRFATKDAVTVAGEICKSAGAPVPSFLDASRLSTTRSAWLKDEIADKTIKALGIVRGKRHVWLALEELDRYEIKEPETSELLFLLYEHTLTKDWLRIVLDGMNIADLPNKLRSIAELYLVPTITLDDIKTYLRRFDAEMQLNIGNVAINATAAVEFAKHQTALAQDPTTALETLVESLKLIANTYLATAGT